MPLKIFAFAFAILGEICKFVLMDISFQTLTMEKLWRNLSQSNGTSLSNRRSILLQQANFLNFSPMLHLREVGSPWSHSCWAGWHSRCEWHNECSGRRSQKVRCVRQWKIHSSDWASWSVCSHGFRRKRGDYHAARRQNIGEICSAFRPAWWLFKYRRQCGRWNDFFQSTNAFPTRWADPARFKTACKKAHSKLPQAMLFTAHRWCSFIQRGKAFTDSP